MKVSGDPQTQTAIAIGIVPSALADDPSGVVGGVQAGYSHQIRWLVLGVEADFQGADISARQSVYLTMDSRSAPERIGWPRPFV